MEESPVEIIEKKLIKNTPIVYKGKVCRICFDGCNSKNIKRSNFEGIKCIKKFEDTAKLWSTKEHSFNKVFSKNDWNTMTNPIAHKKCKGPFFSTTHLNNQLDIVPPEPETVLENEEPSSSDLSTPLRLRRSERKQLKFQSDWKDDEQKRCVICDIDKKDPKGHRVPVFLLEEMDQTTLTLLELAKIHIELETKLKDGARRLSLALTTVSDMVAANVGYHRNCYKQFTSPHWKNKFTDKKEVGKIDFWADFAKLIEIHIVIRKEQYTITQLTDLYNELNEVGGKRTNYRTTDVRKKSRKHLEMMLDSVK